MHYFPEQDVIHLAITDEDEMESIELSPNVTAEINEDGDLIGIEILKASTFLRDFFLESTQAKLMQLRQSVKPSRSGVSVCDAPDISMADNVNGIR